MGQGMKWRAGFGLFLGVTLAGAYADARVRHDVLRDTLANGLRVVIVRDQLAPVVTSEISYLVGSLEAPKGFPGTAHALEHMMFRGSRELDKNQLAEIGARLGGGYNAQTTETATQYFYTAPSEDLGVLLHIEALRMRALSLNAADWEHERGAIEQEVSRDLSSPFYSYISQVQAAMFAGTPYAHDALGTRPSFDATDVALLRHFYEAWYAPNNAILVIAGDVDPDKALAQVKAEFAAIPRKTLPARPDVALTPVKPQMLALDTDYPVGFATVAYRLPGLQAKDFAAADVLCDVLGDQRGALYGLVPAGQALAAEFAYEPKATVGFGVALAAFPKGGDPAPLLAHMRAILADAASKGVSPELVAAAKRKEVAQLAFANNSISGLANSWSQALAFQNLSSPNAIAAAYKAVTPADVDRVARLYLDSTHAITAVLTPSEAGRRIAAHGFGGAESFDATPDHPVALPQWASSALAQLHVPPPGPPPTVSTLANGLRLIVQPVHVSRTISVFGQVRQDPDMQTPAGREGVSQVTEDLFNYGTTHLDRLAFRKAADDIAANLSAGAVFSLQVLTPEFDRGVALLADNELHPAFPAAAFGVVRREAADGVAGLLQSPAYLFGYAVNKAVLPAGDPKLRQATPASVMHLTMADVHDFYARNFRPDLTTIVVIGDITPAHARAVIENSFGGWKVPGPTPHIDLPPVPASLPSHSYVPDSSALQTSVALAETLPLDVADPAHFTLNLGNEILGGGFSSRLYRDLRVKSGYVYTVGSRFNWTRTRGEYEITYGADAGNVDRAKTLALRDLTAMREKPVSDDELRLAKASLLRRLPQERASTDALAMEDLYLTDLGRPLDQPQIAATAYFNTTPTQLQAAFRKWLRPQDLAEVEKGPPLAKAQPASATH
ncbi:M16 family metallopeptidase [Lichenicoccus sp.]|uniref:M16 family metallopeptidase n=1 Tax=Lichenicoccus sp. TaxID=2781899 RepID=UPI003D14C4D4